MFDLSEIRSSAFSSTPDGERLRLLNEQLAYAAARSPFYRETLAGIAPLSSLTELNKLPFLTPDVLRAQGNRLVCVPASAVKRIVSLQTSGSTGDAKRLSFTQGDLERTVAFFTEGMGWLAAPGDAVADRPIASFPVTVEQVLRDNLPLPFPLRAQDSELFDGSLVERELGLAFLEVCHMSYREMCPEMYFDFPRPPFYNKVFEEWGMEQGSDWWGHGKKK